MKKAGTHLTEDELEQIVNDADKRYQAFTIYLGDRGFSMTLEQATDVLDLTEEFLKKEGRKI